MQNSPVDTKAIAKQLRAHGQRFLDAADVLEALPAVSPLTTIATAPALPEPRGFISTAAIHEYVTKRGARINDLAQHFQVTSEAVMKAIEAANGAVAVAQRGWVKTREQIAKDGDARK